MDRLLDQPGPHKRQNNKQKQTNKPKHKETRPKLFFQKILSRNTLCEKKKSNRAGWKRDSLGQSYREYSFAKSRSGPHSLEDSNPKSPDASVKSDVVEKGILGQADESEGLLPLPVNRCPTAMSGKEEGKKAPTALFC